MNCLLLKPCELSNNQAQLHAGDERFNHLQQILKVSQGQSISAGIVNGLMGNATITNIDDKGINLECSFTKAPPKKLPLTIILALPRPKMLRRILQNIAELGVNELYLINSYKVEKSYWQTPLLDPQSIEQSLLNGLSQAKDTVAPKVHCKKLFKPFVEDELPQIIKGKEAFVAHPYQSSLCPKPSNNERVIAIGPEGGFTEYEVNLLKQHGLTSISMGERIYKVENALTLLTQLSYTP